MRRSSPLLFLLLATCLLTGRIHAAGSRDVGVAPAPAWVDPLQIPDQVVAPEGTVARHYLVLESERNVGTEETYTRYVYKLLTQDGVADGSQLNVSFDPAYETLTLHAARVHRDGKVIDHLDPRKIKVLQRETDLDYLLYHGELSALIILEDVRVGDVVEIAHTRRGLNPVFGGRFVDSSTFDWGIPIERARHRLIVPRGRSVDHRWLGERAVAPTRQSTPEHEIWTWAANALPSRTEDDDVPGWYITQPYLQFSEFSDWGAVADWALALYAEAEPATSIREKASALRAAAKSPEETALLAVRFVQEEIRYLGIEDGASSHRPSPPADVLARRFGDCKDKTWLLVSLLRALQFDAAPVLVHSSRGQILDQALPSPYAFNHVIARLHLGGRDYLLDPTLLHQRGPLATRHTARYKRGLVIAPGTKALTAFPAADTDRRVTRVEETFDLASFEGPAVMKVATTYSGVSAERMRSSLGATNAAELGKNYLTFYARYYPEIAASAPIRWRDDEDRNTLTVEESYTIPSFFSKKPESTVWEAEFYPTVISEYLRSPGAAGRRLPLAIPYPIDFSVRTRATLPQDWSAQKESGQVDDEAFAFTRSSDVSGRKAEWTYSLRTKAESVPAEAFSGYVRKLGEARASLGYNLTFNTALADSGMRINWAMVALAGITFALTSFVAYRLLRRNPTEPPPLPPDLADAHLVGIGGWLILVAIGVVLRPFVLLATVYTSLAGYFDLDIWNVVTDATRAEYNRFYAIAIPAELTLNTVLLVLAVVMIVLFFGKRRAFPPVMIGFLLLNLLTMGYNVWAAHTFETSEKELAEAYTELVRAMLVCFVWIPYFKVSRRVRVTFTR